jgi:hypothetical protein
LRRRARGATAAAAVAVAVACAAPGRGPALPPSRPAALPALFDDVQARTFRYFWETADRRTGLVPDRHPRRSPSSIAAVGFALTAYPIGVERGYVTRAEARARVLATLRFFAEAPQGPEPAGRTGHRGFFYHFLDMETGRRSGPNVELSTIDTTLLLAGVLFCQSYFDGRHADERAIRDLADRVYSRVDWTWAARRTPIVSMGWRPEVGHYEAEWRIYDESMILYILALASPTHPLPAEAWKAYTAERRLQTYRGQTHVNFGPLFGHQYSHVWIDFRGLFDDSMAAKGLDYFENSRRATLAQRAYAIANPGGWKGYGENVWGLTACDGPGARAVVNGREVEFWGYAARGAALGGEKDDGTLAPTAALGSLPFAPEIVVPAVLEMHRRYGRHLYSTYGFLDAFNPSVPDGTPVREGRVVPGAGWFDTDYLGIDQGPILAMIENHRSGFVWRVMRKNAHVQRGLLRAGFRGGWLDEVRRERVGTSRAPAMGVASQGGRRDRGLELRRALVVHDCVHGLDHRRRGLFVDVMAGAAHPLHGERGQRLLHPLDFGLARTPFAVHRAEEEAHRAAHLAQPRAQRLGLARVGHGLVGTQGGAQVVAAPGHVAGHDLFGDPARIGGSVP